MQDGQNARHYPTTRLVSFITLFIIVSIFVSALPFPILKISDSDLYGDRTWWINESEPYFYDFNGYLRFNVSAVSGANITNNYYYINETNNITTYINETVYVNESVLNASYLRIDTANDPLTGSLDIGKNNITNITALVFNNITIKQLAQNSDIDGSVFGIMMTNPPNQELPHFILQSGGPSQASVLLRSMMIQNEINDFSNTTNVTSCVDYMNIINETLKIDCNTTTTGADLLVSDDMQVIGDLWLKDTMGEWHFMTRELSLSDSMKQGTIQGNLQTEHNDTLFSIGNSQESVFVVNVQGINYFVNNNATVALTSGTNSTPVRNYLTFQVSAGDAVLTNDISYPSTIPHTDIAVIIKGSDGNVYLHLELPTKTQNFIYEIYDQATNAFEKYISGFSIDATSTNLNFTSGKYWTVLQEFESTNILNLNIDGFYTVLNNGTFVQCIDLSCLIQYSDGATIAGNAYFNVVWAIVPDSGNTSRLIAIPQNEPGSTYTTTTSAEQDNFKTITYLFDDSEITKHKLILARTIVKNSDDTFQTFSNGEYYQTLIGIPSAGAAAGGTNDHSLLTNLDYASSGHTGFFSLTDILNYYNKTQVYNTTESDVRYINEDGDITGTGVFDWSQSNHTNINQINATLINSLWNGSVLYYTISQIDSFLSSLNNLSLTQIVTNIGNWSADKTNYYTKTQSTFYNYSKQTSCPAGQFYNTADSTNLTCGTPTSSSETSLQRQYINNTYKEIYLMFPQHIGQTITTGTIAYGGTPANIFTTVTSITTGTTSGNDAYILFEGTDTAAGGSGATLKLENIKEIEISLNYLNTNTSVNVLLGSTRTATSNVLNSYRYGVFFLKNTTISDWQAVSCQNYVCTYIKTGIVSNNFDTTNYIFSIKRNSATNYNYKILNYNYTITYFDQNITTNLPTSQLSMIGAWIETQTTSARQINLRYAKYIVETI